MAKQSQQTQLPIIAIIEYRLEIPDHWDFNRFCRLKFEGTDDLACEDHCIEWNRIEFKKFFESLEKIAEIQERKSELIQLHNTLHSEYSSSRVWYKRITPEQRELFSAVKATQKKISEVDHAIADIENDRFYDPVDLYQMAKNFLIEKGFGFVSKSRVGFECATYTEVWHQIEES